MRPVEARVGSLCNWLGDFSCGVEGLCDWLGDFNCGVESSCKWLGTSLVK